MLKNKKILTGITGGAAIYKICSLIRILKREGAQIIVVLTKNAQKMISPSLFQALSGSPVFTSLFDSSSKIGLPHIELAQWADIFVVAPATANTIGKMANGIADNLLTTIFLALPPNTPVLIVPAMDTNMWENIFVQENIKKLQKRKKLKMLSPKEGLLASGKKGKGRMAEPKEILKAIKKLL